MRRLVSRPALALALILLPQLAARALACSCLPIPSPYQALKQSRAVFVGKVVGQRDAESQEEVNGRTYTVRERLFRFSVDEAFKGALGQEVEVSAGRVDSMCFVGFDAGETYVVSALFALDEAGSPLAVEEEGFGLAEGKYRFYGLTPGRYLPAVNIRAPVGTRAREARFYYPGTADASEAREVEVGGAAHASGRDIRLPKGYVVRQVEGVVVWPDGSPVKDAWVSLDDSARPGEDDEGYDSARVDERGRFSLQGFVGARYWVHASRNVRDLRFGGKPLPDEGADELEARPLRINVRRANAPLRLVILPPEGFAAPDRGQENRR